MDKAWFIQSRVGNIKDHYFFEKKLGSGGYGAVYLAKNKTSGTQPFFNKFRSKSGCEGDAKRQNHRLRFFQKRNHNLDAIGTARES